MSSSFGGACVTVPSASRNIVWQNGQAVPMTCAPVATSSSTRSMFTRLPFSSPRNIRPPRARGETGGHGRDVHAFALLFAQEHLAAAGPAAEGTLARARHFHHCRGLCDYRPRLVVFLAVTAQIARVVVNHGLAPPPRPRRGQPVRQPRQQFAVMLNLERRARLPPIRPDGPHAMRAYRHHLLDLGRL